MLDFKYKNMRQNIRKFAIVLCHGVGQKEHKFPIVTILTQKNLGIPTSQIEIKKIFFVVKALTTL